jgi:ABC-2 type transport system ATP-binding protein
VRLDAVSKRYGWRQPWVVRDVSLDVKPGGLVRLEGKNGTGKSTLLRVIAGVSAPTRGTVTGRPVTGYVPERFPPGLPFTAQEYLSHLGRIQRLDGAALQARIGECLARLGGLEFAAVPMRNMSKGMCQKVAVAQALLPESGMLVLDEAWTGLDAEARAALDEVVSERLAEGGSVVFVDHDPLRLDHLEAERYRIENGEANPSSGATPAPPVSSASGAPPASGVAGEVMLIELAGIAAEQLEWVSGVLSVQDDDDRVLLRVEAASSDAVLRAVLAVGDDVHIRRVGQAGRAGRASEEQR